jgi:hypothetical protein
MAMQCGARDVALISVNVQNATIETIKIDATLLLVVFVLASFLLFVCYRTKQQTPPAAVQNTQQTPPAEVQNKDTKKMKDFLSTPLRDNKHLRLVPGVGPAALAALQRAKAENNVDTPEKLVGHCLRLGRDTDKISSLLNECDVRSPWADQIAEALWKKAKSMDFARVEDVPDVNPSTLAKLKKANALCNVDIVDKLLGHFFIFGRDTVTMSRWLEDECKLQLNEARMVVETLQKRARCVDIL